MDIKTIFIPNINCGHCTHAIKNELGELPGVVKVEAEVTSKQVTVEWAPPATWEAIKNTLIEINYPPVP